MEVNSFGISKVSIHNNKCNRCNDLFSLQDMGSVTDLDLDSNRAGYIILYRNCFHCTDSDSDYDLDLDSLSLLYLFL